MGNESLSGREPRFNLARHFGRLYGLEHMSPLSMTQAEHVLEDPQEHIDELVEAGILKLYRGAYYVVNPHKHTWVTKFNNNEIRIMCTTCPAKGKVIEE